MLEILVLAIAGLALLQMAKRRRRRRMGRYIRGNIDVDIAGGTLAGATAVLGATADQVVERAYLSSIVCQYSFAGFTGGDNIGPVSVGVAHGDYSLAEIEAYLEAATSWNEGDLVAREVSQRKIRRIGTFTTTAASAGEANVLNDGKSIRTKLGWILNTGQGLNFWLYNQGSAAFATTDPNVHIWGHANLWPR